MRLKSELDLVTLATLVVCLFVLSSAESFNWSACSQSCGGGVSTRQKCLMVNGETVCDDEIKACNHQPCVGPSLWTQMCEQKSRSFKPLIPEAESCRLSCFSDAGVYRVYNETFLPDGTECSINSICVQGICKRVGCDGIVRSEKRFDKCGVCGGEGSTCTREAGGVQVQITNTGVTLDVIEIPAGATSVVVTKDTDGNIFVLDISEESGLKMTENEGKEKLTIRGPIQTPLTVSLRASTVGSVRVEYEFYIPNKERGFEGETSGRSIGDNSSSDSEYVWVTTPAGECTVRCGGGIQNLLVSCAKKPDGLEYTDEHCDGQPKPSHQRVCNTHPCKARWVATEWSECSDNCEDGERARNVYCEQESPNMFDPLSQNIIIPDEECLLSDGPKPSSTELCSGVNCPARWKVTHWSTCDADCFQTRELECVQNGNRVENVMCSAELLPELVQKCAKCEPTAENEMRRDGNDGENDEIIVYKWTAGQWSECSSDCGEGMRSREVSCQSSSSPSSSGMRVTDGSLCDPKTKPPSLDTCYSKTGCNAIWFASPWEECSVVCGWGIQKRQVKCVLESNRSKEAEEGETECNRQTKPQAHKSCFLNCNTQWTHSNWSKCSSKCGPGSQKREVMCKMEDGTLINDRHCEKQLRPPSNRTCNLAPCLPNQLTPPAECGLAMDYGDCGQKVFRYYFEPISASCEVFVYSGCGGNRNNFPNRLKCESTCAPTKDNVMMSDEQSCQSSLYGCCPDGVTFARGRDYLGCPPSCDRMPFGCCPDGVSVAQGPDYYGCGPACMFTMYGCCKDNKSHAHGPNYEGCDEIGLHNTWEEKPVQPRPEPQPRPQPQPRPDPRPIAADSSDVATMYDSCIYSAYGCCPDGSAAYPDRSNCRDDPIYVCQYTTYGCCPDGETAAADVYQSNCHYNPSTHPDMCHGVPPDRYMNCGGTYESKYFFNETSQQCDHYWASGCQQSFGFPSNEECRTHCGVAGSNDYYHYYNQYPNHHSGNYWQWDRDHYDPYWAYYYGHHGNNNPYGYNPYYPYNPYQYGYAAGEQLPTAGAQPAPEISYVYPEPKPQPQPQPQTGPCSGAPRSQNLCALEYTLKYFYNSTSGMCQSYYDGGCDSSQNQNSYSSRMLCRDSCIPPAVVADSVPVPPTYYYAYQPVAEDPKYNNMYNSDYLASLEGGWANSGEAMPTRRAAPPPQGVSAACEMSPDAGPCRAYMYRWYFNRDSGRCDQFIYGGCQGNQNNFASQSDCARLCLSGSTGGGSSLQLIADWRLVEVNRGDTAVLQCNIIPMSEYNRNMVVRWMKSGSGVGGTNSPVIVSEGNKVRVSTTGRLEINSAEQRDSGVYVCSLDDNGVVKSDNVTLTVTDKERVRITERPASQISMPVGAAMTLNCKAQGNPQPSITWSRDSERLSTGESWTKYAWSEGETGYYRCEATNGYTSDVAYFYINVDASYPLYDQDQPQRQPQPTRVVSPPSEPTPIYNPQPQPMNRMASCVDSRPDCNVYLSYCSNEAFYQTCCMSCRAAASAFNPIAGSPYANPGIRYPVS